MVTSYHLKIKKRKKKGTISVICCRGSFGAIPNHKQSECCGTLDSYLMKVGSCIRRYCFPGFSASSYYHWHTPISTNFNLGQKNWENGISPNVNSDFHTAGMQGKRVNICDAEIFKLTVNFVSTVYL